LEERYKDHAGYVNEDVKAFINEAEAGDVLRQVRPLFAGLWNESGVRLVCPTGGGAGQDRPSSPVVQPTGKELA